MNVSKTVSEIRTKINGGHDLLREEVELLAAEIDRLSFLERIRDLETEVTALWRVVTDLKNPKK